ncbi:MAG: hypothetical protein GY874_03065 [Desulfobacteraceae bacterium]|nr:hypothetical protein [Desulfobacteraceae bacterium]
MMKARIGLGMLFLISVVLLTTIIFVANGIGHAEELNIYGKELIVEGVNIAF